MTTTVDSLLASKDAAHRSDVTALDDADIADLTLRAGDFANSYQMKALSILAERAFTDVDVSAAVTSLVDQLLSTPGLADLARAEIISHATVAANNSLPTLLTAAVGPDTDVAVAAWRALQLIARSSDLADLQNAAPAKGTELGDQAAFTIALVAYRAGIAGYELPLLDEAHLAAIANDEEQLNSINQSSTTADEFALVSELSAGELYLIAAQRESTTTIRCGDQQMLVCLDPELQPGWPQTLTQSPAMPGAVLVVDPLATSAAVRLLLLSTPDGEGGFYTGAYLPSGELLYQGRARSENITADTATFSWWAISRPAVRPISLGLSVSSAGVELNGDRLSAITAYSDSLAPTEVAEF